jgi:hypothetical protein
MCNVKGADGVAHHYVSIKGQDENGFVIGMEQTHMDGVDGINSTTSESVTVHDRRVVIQTTWESWRLSEVDYVYIPESMATFAKVVNWFDTGVATL